MISSIQNLFSTYHPNIRSDGRRAALPAGRSRSPRPSTGLTLFSTNRASDVESPFGSLWNPNLLDDLRAPLTRFHE